MPLRISLLHEFEQHEDETYHICFSPDGNTLWSSDQIALYQWQRSSGDIWSYSQRLPDGAYRFQCAADGKMLVFWDGAQKRIRFLSYDGKEQMTLSHPDQNLSFDFALSPDQRWLVTGGKDGDLLLCDMVNHQWSSISVPDQPDAANGTTGCFCFRFALNGLGLIFITSGGQIHICHFDPEHDHYAIRKIVPIYGICEMRISPNGKLLAITNVGADNIRGYMYMIWNNCNSSRSFLRRLAPITMCSLFRLTANFWRAVEMRAFSTSGRLQRLSVSLPSKLIKAQDPMRDIGQKQLVGLIGQRRATSQQEERASSEMICRKKIVRSKYGK
jgi:WD40 repeat protein